MRKFLFAAALGLSGLGLSALAATPAAAQAYQGTPPPPEGYYDEGYTGPEEWATEGSEGTNGNGYYETDDRQTSYRDGPRRYQPGDQYRGDGVAYNGNPRNDRRYRERRCSGTTGAILGGIAGALLGGDLGGRPTRYGYRRSGTGTVVGAGVGAVIGSEIDRNSCEERRGYR